MSADAEHPSYLALDRACLGLITSELESHLEGCEACRGYVEAQREGAPTAGLAAVRRRIEAKNRKLAWLAAPLAPLAIAAAFLLYARIHPQPALPRSAPYIGEKGFASVWIYVKHGAKTNLWDGKAQVFAGDRLRLKVDPGRFQRVEVYSTKNPDTPELLYEGRVLPGQSSTLPDAWEVDAEPGDERLLVVFSSEPVKPSWPEWLRGKSQPGVVLLPFVLPKSPTPDQSPGSTNP